MGVICRLLRTNTAWRKKQRRSPGKFGVSLLLALCSFPIAAQTTIHVPADQPTIQSGIDAAKNGDTVFVSPGTYNENIDFKGKAITVTSGATSYAAATTTIIQPATVGPVVRLATSEPSTTVLNGFTIQGAHSDYTFAQDIAGIVISGSSPLIANNIIQQNIACGVLVDAGGSPTIQGNHIWQNRFPTANDEPSLANCGPSNGFVAGVGLAVFNGGSVTIQSNLVEENSDAYPDGQAPANNAGVSILNSINIFVLDNVLRNNYTFTNVAGRSLEIGYQTPNRTTVVLQNLTDGLQISGPDAIIQVPYTKLAIINNTINGAFYLYPDYIAGSTIENNIVYDPYQGNYSLECLSPISPSHPVKISYNDFFSVSNLPSGCPLDSTDLQADPLFLNPTAGDYHTQRTSPVVAAGDINAPDIQPEDLDHKNRTVCGTIDMGVYEIHPQPPIALTVSPNPAPGQSSVTLTAALTGNCNTPTGLVTFTDGNTVLGTAQLNGSAIAAFSTSFLYVGTHILTATYPGDFNFDGSTSNTITEIITGPPSTTFLSVSPNPALPLQPITMTATVSSAYSTPAGTITFMTGGATLATATVAANGTASATISTLGAGTYSITAVYSGSTEYAGSTSNAVLEVVNGAPTTTSLTSAPNPSSFGQTVTLTATVAAPQSTTTPTGTVTFMDGAITLGSAPLSASNVAQFSTAALSAGTHTLTALYSGSTNDAKSTSNTVMQIVGLDVTATTLTATPNPANLGQTVVLTASVNAQLSILPNPAGAVVFTDQFGVLGSAPLMAGTAALSTGALSLGTHNIVATYSAGSGYATSKSTAVAEVVQSFDFTLGLSSTSVHLPSGDYHSLMVTLLPVGGFRDTVGLSCTSVPVNAQCVFQPSSASLANGPQTVMLIVNTSQIFEFGNQASSHNPPQDMSATRHPILLAFLILPLLPLCRPKQKRFSHLSKSLVLVIAIACATALLGLQGCGGGKLPAATPPGTYTITVVAADTATSLTHSVNIQLVVH